MTPRTKLLAWFGGRKRGVVSTDQAGNQQIIPLPGDATQFLGGDGAFHTPGGGSGVGDVVGPAGATDGDFAQYDGTTGKLLKDGGYSPSSFDTAGAAAAAIVTAEAYADAGDAAAIVTAEAYTDTVAATRAPKTAEYVVKSADGTLTAERVLTDNTEITFDWSVAGVVKAVLASASIALSKLVDLAGLSVLGRASNSSGVMAAITAANDGEVLRRSGTSIGFGAVNLASGNAVTGQLPLANLAARTTSLEITFDNGTSDIAANTKWRGDIPVAATLTKWRILGDSANSIVFDIQKDTYANYPPTSGDSIINTGAGGTKPTLSSAAANEDATLAHYTTSFAAGDTIIVNVDSCTGIKQATLILTFSY